jgi:hypothetical protein
MSKRKLDLDRTRERMLALGLNHAAEQLEPALSEAVKDNAGPHHLLDTLLETDPARFRRASEL